jgi:predicted dehydrogenase
MKHSHKRAKKVRYAVIGAGNIAQIAILPAFRHADENSELVALVSGDAQKRGPLAERYDLRFTGGYDELEDVLERSHADAVYVTTPNTLHREHTERAARVKRHVLCEKPLAPSVADCEAMIACCNAAGVRLMTAYRLHFEEANLRAVEIAQNGQIGKPKLLTSLHTQQLRPGDIRARKELAGGALYDMGVYCINAARYLFQAEPVRVFATMTRGDSRFDGVDATTTAVLCFEDERVAQFCASLEAAQASTYHLIGEKGDLLVDPAFAYAEGLRHVLSVGEHKSERRFSKRDQFAAEIVAFSRAILEGTELEPSGEEGLADVRVVEALFESARSGRVVELPPFDRRVRPSLRQEIHMPPLSKPEVIKAPSPSQGHSRPHH